MKTCQIVTKGDKKRQKATAEINLPIPVGETGPPGLASRTTRWKKKLTRCVTSIESVDWAWMGDELETRLGERFDGRICNRWPCLYVCPIGGTFDHSCLLCSNVPQRSNTRRSSLPEVLGASGVNSKFPLFVL